ncbi:hypothetical protein BJF78_06485 [Pseudonocardia sp. CNS-139]|nr:hypothetical protein BJF78_06485 [Pseudonocardia sp. CNS-139]
MTVGGGRSGVFRPLRHAALTTGLVLVVSAALAGYAGVGLAGSAARIGAATGRAVGVVDEVRDGPTVLVRWTPPGGPERVDAVPVAGPPPAPACARRSRSTRPTRRTRWSPARTCSWRPTGR